MKAPAMTRHGKLFLTIYGAIASPLLVIGFAGLISKRTGWRIPLVSTDIIPALHRHAVWGETLKGRAILLSGEDWFFLIVLGFVIVLGILLATVNRLIRSAAKK